MLGITYDAVSGDKHMHAQPRLQGLYSYSVGWMDGENPACIETPAYTHTHTVLIDSISAL